jgi:hypothetical protein
MLPSIQHGLNNAVSRPLGRNPNEVVYGFKPLTCLELLKASKADEDLNVVRKQYQDEAQKCIKWAAAKVKFIYDREHRSISFEVGQKVFLRLHKGYNLASKAQRKYSPQRAGPFRILKKHGPLAYELDLPQTEWFGQ